MQKVCGGYKLLDKKITRRIQSMTESSSSHRPLPNKWSKRKF